MRYGRRQPDRLRAPWATLHIEGSRDARLSEPAKDKIAATLRLAEQLGAETVTLPGENVTQEILAYAHANNFIHIIVGKSAGPRWREWFAGSVSHELIRSSNGISVHVISTGGGDPAKARPLAPAALDADIAAAHWAWEHDLPPGRGADTLPGAKRLYLPLKTGRTRIGVLGLDNDRQGPILTPELRRLLD